MSDYQRALVICGLLLICAYVIQALVCRKDTPPVFVPSAAVNLYSTEADGSLTKTMTQIIRPGDSGRYTFCGFSGGPLFVIEWETGASQKHDKAGGSR